ncbi:MAG: response regulator [Actinomycetota bacterium]|nr:response regulator [Actinomycetota bacterium]
MATTPVRVLLVEDDADVAALLRRHLKALGCAVTLVSSGEEALASAATSPPDVAVVDIMLPGIDGRQVARAHPATPGGLTAARPLRARHRPQRRARRGAGIAAAWPAFAGVADWRVGSGPRHAPSRRVDDPATPEQRITS